MTTSHEHPDRDLADEVFTDRSAPTTVLPTYEMPAVSADPAIGEPTDLGAPASRPVTSEPAWLTGPAAVTLHGGNGRRDHARPASRRR